ncbi:MAG: hypothetical protein WBD09_08325 [Halobacteriota archaeon]
MNGNGNKVVLMAIAVVAVGIFALPGTVSLFSGQHTWYDISGDEKLPCVKCHADIQDEYLKTGVHAMLGGSNSSNYTAGIDKPNDACYACHRVVYEARGNITYASGYGKYATPGKQAHAASTVACMACHEFNQSFNASATPFGFTGGFAAGGFSDPYVNISGGVDPVTKMKFNYTNGTANPGGYAAHQGFIEGAINNTRMEDANEACIACHTAIPVKITWTHAYSLEFNATYNESLSLPPTHFDTSNYSANGTVIAYSYGNASGGANTTHFP